LRSETFVLDSTVVVKWFKEGEEHEEEATELRKRILSSEVAAAASEVMPLEVCRALVKAGYDSARVRRAYATLTEMSELGFLKLVPASSTSSSASEGIIGLGLYVADALVLAAALSISADLVTEDKHLLKQSVHKRMSQGSLRVLRLRDLGGPKQRDGETTT
jgi:predicted nucleic acid-binding protein